MKLAYMFSGNAPVLHKYQIGEAMATAGVPVEIETLAGDVYGLQLCETTTCVDAVGVTLDAQATRNTAQQTDNADPAVQVTVNISPGAVYHAQLSGGATTGTALATFAVTAASADGLTITAPFTDTYDDGYAWGAAGANLGLPSLRKLTAVSATAATLIVAARYDIAVGDTFYAFTGGPAADAGVQLTTALDEVDATVDLQGTDNFRCPFVHAKDGAEVAQGDVSWVELVLYDHIFGGNIT